MRYLSIASLSVLGFVVLMAVFIVFGDKGLRMLLISVAIAGLPLSVWYTRRMDKLERLRAIAHMADRPQLTSNQFGQKYFPSGQMEIATRLRNILAKHIELDLSGLHPDDRLVDDIRMDALDSLSTLEFLMEVEKEFGLEIPNSEAATMFSFRDVVSYVIAHVDNVGSKG